MILIAYLRKYAAYLKWWKNMKNAPYRKIMSVEHVHRNSNHQIQPNLRRTNWLMIQIGMFIRESC